MEGRKEREKEVRGNQEREENVYLTPEKTNPICSGRKIPIVTWGWRGLDGAGDVLYGKWYRYFGGDKNVQSSIMVKIKCVYKLSTFIKILST